jgi:hypothetical protein
VDPTTICFFSKPNARALVGGLLMGTGGLIGAAGLAVLLVSGFNRAGGPKALGTAAEVTGAGVSLAGAPEVGAGIAAAGGGVRSAARHREKRRAADETALRRQVGEPRENPAMEPRGGVVRENELQRQQRKRRERRSVSPGGKPASREEAGF